VGTYLLPKVDRSCSFSFFSKVNPCSNGALSENETQSRDFTQEKLLPGRLSPTGAVL